MKIEIENNLYIESDDMQFILKQYSGKFDKNGKETYKVLGYFSTIKQVVKHILKMEVMKSTASTLKELLLDVERIENKINDLIEI